MVEVEVLYFEGCPSWRTAWAELGDVLEELRLDASVHLRDIDTLDEREKRGFGGSPSIRIDGRDLEGYDGPTRIACRRYLDNGGKGWPARRLLRARLEEAAAARADSGRSRS